MGIATKAFRSAVKSGHVIDGPNFEEWWQLYPRRAKRSETEEEWSRLTAFERRCALDSLRSQLVDLIKRANDPNGNFCPTSYTWLSERRFEGPPIVQKKENPNLIRPPGMPVHAWVNTIRIYMERGLVTLEEAQAYGVPLPEFEQNIHAEEPDHPEQPTIKLVHETDVPDPDEFTDDAGSEGVDDATIIQFPDKRPEIQLTVGERPRVTDKVFDVILKEGDLYNYGSKLSHLDNGKAVEVNEEFVADYLERRISFFKMKPTRDGDFERVTVDTPGWLSKRVCKLSKQAIPKLTDIITAPTLRPDGSILSKPGYDPDTQLLLLPGAYPETPISPTMDDVREAWKTLWFPFRLFPFVSDDDRATAAACALTAPVRKILPKAPATNFDAAMSSSGKTLLASICQEMSGRSYVYSYSNDTEFKKTITATLRDGYQSLLLDNIRGVVDSPAMEAFLSSETWCDRVLGASTMFDGPSRILFLISGNNFQPGGDLWSRVLNCRIDPKSTKPETRTFDFCPQEHTRQNRQKIVAAALTILRGFKHLEAPKTTAETLARFPDWDKLVRQCVIWLETKGLQI